MINLPGPHNETCRLAAELSQADSLFSLLVSKVVLSLLGAFSTLILLRLELRYMLAHPNVTILLINHNVGLVGACGIYCYKSISKLASYMGKGVLGEEACFLTVDKHHCTTSNYPKSIFYTACVFALIIFAFERLIATFKYRTYENKAKKKFGFALIIFQWLLASSAVLSNAVIFKPDFGAGDDEYVAFCSGILASGGSGYACTLLVCEILALGMFLFARFDSDRKNRLFAANRADHSLTERYQLQENIRTTNLMVPTVACHVLFSAGGLIALVAYISHNRDDTINFPIAMETIELTTPLYAVLYPIVNIVLNKKYRRDIRRWLCGASSSPAVSATTHYHHHNQSIVADPVTSYATKIVDAQKMREDHFAKMNAIWKSPPMKVTTLKVSASETDSSSLPSSSLPQKV
uniref:Uncharacterized protein n=1 Tax=Plectus sambesii TaxID=2011161 RepID=A0A914W1Q2_9BILA